MKLCLKLLAIAVISTVTYSLTSCAAPASFSYQNISIALTAQCYDCPLGILYNPSQPTVEMQANQGEGGEVLWTATVTNAPQTNVQWAIYPQPNLGQIGTPPTASSTPVGESGSSVGSISAASGNTVYYADTSPPIYGGAALVQTQTIQWTQNGVVQTGIPQGDILLVASVPSTPTANVPNCTLQPITPGCVSQGQLIQIFNNTNAQGPPSVYLVPKTPTNPSGLTTPVATVSHLAPNNTFQFYGGAVGASPCFSSCSPNPVDYTDNSVTWEVGTNTTNAAPCTVAATCPEGTISATGLYTAPAVVPPSPPVIVLAAHILPTITAVAYITVN